MNKIKKYLYIFLILPTVTSIGCNRITSIGSNRNAMMKNVAPSTSPLNCLVEKKIILNKQQEVTFHHKGGDVNNPRNWDADIHFIEDDYYKLDLPVSFAPNLTIPDGVNVEEWLTQKTKLYLDPEYKEGNYVQLGQTGLKGGFISLSSKPEPKSRSLMDRLLGRNKVPTCVRGYCSSEAFKAKLCFIHYQNYIEEKERKERKRQERREEEERRRQERRRQERLNRERERNRSRRTQNIEIDFNIVYKPGPGFHGSINGKGYYGR